MTTDSDNQIEGNARLEFTLDIREKMVRELTSSGVIPADNANKALLISALDGMDRTVLSRAKVKVAEKTNDLSTQANSLIAKLLTQVRPKQISENNYDVNIKPLSLDSSISKPDTIEGEMVIGTTSETFDEFTTRMEK